MRDYALYELAATHIVVVLVRWHVPCGMRRAAVISVACGYIVETIIPVCPPACGQARYSSAAPPAPTAPTALLPAAAVAATVATAAR